MHSLASSPYVLEFLSFIIDYDAQGQCDIASILLVHNNAMCLTITSAQCSSIAYTSQVLDESKQRDLWNKVG